MSMKLWIKIAVVAMTLVSFARESCADFYDRKLSDRQVATIRRLGVVSTLGDQLHGSKVALMAFGNRRFEAAAADWALNEAAVEEAMQVARSDSRLNAVDVLTLNATARGAVYTGQDDDLQFQGPVILQVAEAQGFDAVLALVQVTPVGEPFLHTPMTFMSLENYGSPPGTMSRTSYSYLLPCIMAVWRLMDVPSGKVLGVYTGANRCGKPDPLLTWHDTWGDYTAAERLAIENDFKVWLKDMTRVALSNMGLGARVGKGPVENWRSHWK